MARWTRRGVLSAGAAGLAGCLAPQSGLTDGVDAWPVRRHDPQRTGHNPEASGPSAGRERWIERLDAAAAAPVARDGDVYVGADAIYALVGSNGARRWRRFLPFDGAVSPAVAAGTVYGASGRGLYAIERATGQDRWFRTTTSWRFHAAVGVGRTLYLGATKVRYTNDFDARVLALDVRDGTEQWHADVGQNVIPPFVPAVDGARVYVGRDAVYALDAGDGDRAWTFRTPEVVAYGDPCVVDGTVYVGGVRPTEGVPEGAVLALDARDGTERWRFETRLVPAPPAIAEGTVYAPADRVYALDARDGTKRWDLDSNRYATASPAVAGGRVYLAGIGGVVRALDAATGTPQWRLPTLAGGLSAPAVVGETAYVAGLGGRVIAIGGE